MRRAAGEDFSTATDLADYLVRQGLPFRQAHEVVGRIVRHAIDGGRTLEALSLEELRTFSELFGPDVTSAISVDASLRARAVTGGTAPDAVRALAGAGPELRRAAMRRRALLVAAALTLAACGKVGAPVPPEVRLPATIKNLGGHVRPGAVQLHWTNPDRRVDGTVLRDLETARVFRTDDDGTGEPRTAMLVRNRVPGYVEVARVDLRPGEQKETPGAIVRGGRVDLTDERDLAYGRRYTYVVITEDAQDRISAPSARVSLLYAPAPETPARLRAEPGEQEVRLAWDAPARLVDGAPVPPGVTYEVLRAASAEAEPTLLTRQPITGTQFTDENLENDRTYHYRVRAVRQEGETQIRGNATAAVEGTPRDMTPPTAPANLVAVPSGRDVRLIWSPSPDADVAGYIVYRASGDGAFARIGSTRAPATTFVDRGLAPGTHRYVVSAQDSGAQPNESARSEAAAVTLP